MAYSRVLLRLLIQGQDAERQGGQIQIFNCDDWNKSSMLTLTSWRKDDLRLLLDSFATTFKGDFVVSPLCPVLDTLHKLLKHNYVYDP